MPSKRIDLDSLIYALSTSKIALFVGLPLAIFSSTNVLNSFSWSAIIVFKTISAEAQFADEPTAELDTNTGLQVMKIFKELIESEGLTIVMTTHDTELMKLGDRVYQLEEGELVE